MDEKLYLVFFLLWCFYELSSCAFFATAADQSCDEGDDDIDKSICNGQAGAAAMYCVSAVLALVAAFKFKSQDKIMYGAFVVSVAFDAFGWLSYSAYNADIWSEYYDRYNYEPFDDRAKGFTAAAVFYAFAAICFVLTSIFASQGNDTSNKGSYVFLALGFGSYAMGFCSWIGGMAASSCDDENQSSDSDTACSGFRTSTVFFALAFLAIFYLIYAGFSDPSVPNLWKFTFAYFFFMLAGFSAYYNTLKDLFASDDDDYSNQFAYTWITVCDAIGAVLMALPLVLLPFAPDLYLSLRYPMFLTGTLAYIAGLFWYRGHDAD
jgi:hypothetical protein